MEITIEPMTSDAIPAVADIMIEAFNAPPINETWTKETGQNHLEKECNEGFSFIAKDQNEIVGALVGSIDVYDKGEEYFIDTFVVRESHRDQGIGKQLMDRAIEAAKSHNIRSISLESSAKLRVFAWYKELGFEETGWVELSKTLV